eukprot:3269107-Amphidinium_carterae.2
MQARRNEGEVITTAYQTRLLQKSIENFDCDTMAVVIFSWAHTSQETKMFRPKKPQHTRAYRMGQELCVHVQGYHLELTSTVLGLRRRPYDKDFHTLLNVSEQDIVNIPTQNGKYCVSRERRSRDMQGANMAYKTSPRTCLKTTITLSSVPRKAGAVELAGKSVANLLVGAAVVNHQGAPGMEQAAVPGND